MSLEVTIDHYFQAEECSHAEDITFDELFLHDGELRFPLLFEKTDFIKPSLFSQS